MTPSEQTRDAMQWRWKFEDWYRAMFPDASLRIDYDSPSRCYYYDDEQRAWEKWQANNLPVEPPQPVPLAALADDMAKALAEGINYQQQMGIPPKWGRDVLTEMRAALDRFRAAKKEQA